MNLPEGQLPQEQNSSSLPPTSSEMTLLLLVLAFGILLPAVLIGFGWLITR